MSCFIEQYIYVGGGLNALKITTSKRRTTQLGENIGSPPIRCAVSDG